MRPAMASEGTTRLVLVRHGEVEERYQRVFGGRIDMDLSAHGEEQARQTARFLERIPVDGLYVSPMRRAQQTVQPIAAVLNRQPLTLPELREVDFGIWTGLSWEEVGSRHGVSAYDWLSELQRGGIPEAESMTAYRARIAQALDTMLAGHPGKVIGAVCHGGVIRALLSHLLDLPLPKTAHFEINYASVTVIDQKPHRSEIQLLNYTPWRLLP